MDEVVRGIGTPILGLALFALWGLWSLIRRAADQRTRDHGEPICFMCCGGGVLPDGESCPVCAAELEVADD